MSSTRNENVIETVVCPFTFKFAGCDVIVYEVLPTLATPKETWFNVVLRIIYRGKMSKIFSIVAKDKEDFRRKLLIEISKFKMCHLMGVPL